MSMDSTAIEEQRPPVPDVEKFVRYTHLDKSYGYLPGMREAQPTLFGLSPESYQAARERFARAAREAAETLLAGADETTAIDRWTVAGPSTVLVVGDSLTDDLQSWVEILRAALGLRRPDHAVRLINGGLSAHTSAMILRSWPATLAAVKPDVVVCALGGNDVTRVGPGARKTQVSIDESLANLSELRRIAKTLVSPRWIWVTPASVDEDRVAGFPPFRFGHSSWANTDVRLLVDGMRGLGGPLIDLTTVFGIPAAPDLVGDDGVHPTLAGQLAIARAAVAPLARACERRQ
ncbi:SGNH/GDSL hydrolase family protein [Nocardia wallacei]|uniref:SGNH/GDSL hydrolase family protein n=1 Tax=Nocardia wallacei TaxID=480035 RepID=UPI0024580C35|nr:GDSL-type esterase/lipase family protein [Nocardia wallacei]